MSNLSINGSITIDAEEKEEKEIHHSKCINFVSRYIAILKWLPKYTRIDAVSDLIAGITLGLTMIPQSIAYAALAGLTAQYGLYSAFAGSMVYVFFGTIKEVSIGPTSLMSLLTIEFTRNMPLEFVVLLSFLAGCVELIWGIFNLGFLVDFISVPVTSGFTSATSVIVIIGQLQGLFGLKYKSTSSLDNVIKIFQHISDIRIADTLVGVLSIIFLLLFKKMANADLCGKLSNKRRKIVEKSLWVLSIGRNALLILVASVVASTMLTDGKAPFILSGKVESGLPSFNLPPFTAHVGNKTYSFFDMCSQLSSSIIVVPLVAVLANISIAKAFASGKAIDASQEMRSLGLCNIFGSFVQSMPTCGAFSRSAVSNASGVRTPLSGLYAGIMTLFALSFLTPYFYYIPRAALAAVLISAVVFMIDWSIIPILWRGSKKDLIAAISTFCACILSVEYGLLFGIGLNVAYLLHAWARPSIRVTECETLSGKKYVLIRPDIGMYYPTIDFLRDRMNKIATQEGKNKLPLVLDCDRFKDVDYSAAKGLEVMASDFDKKRQQLLFVNLSENILKKIQVFGVMKKLEYAESKEYKDKLFEDTIEITRDKTVSVSRLTADEKGNTAGPIFDNKNSALDGESEDRERKTLLTGEEAEIRRLTANENLEEKESEA